MVIVTMKLFSIGGYDMENTHEYVRNYMKIKKRQTKIEKKEAKAQASNCLISNIVQISSYNLR
jgi:hypothetical protein